MNSCQNHIPGISSLTKLPKRRREQHQAMQKEIIVNAKAKAAQAHAEKAKKVRFNGKTAPGPDKRSE